MMAKLSKAERKRLREARKEFQIIIRRSRQKGFQYIVVREEPSKNFFGSTIERECIPAEGQAMSAFMRRFISPPRPIPGPGYYEIPQTLIKNYAPLKGYDGLAKRTPRTPALLLSIAPPVGTYDVERPKVFKQCCKPFGSGAPLDTKINFITPPPGNYNFRKQKTDNVALAFGSQRRIIPAVKIICSPHNHSKCVICEQQPVGDYWHCYATNQDMCRPCMINEMDLVKYKCNQRMTSQKSKRRAELESFVRVRYCGFYHEHNGTTAAIRLLTRRELLSKIRGENYLSKFHM